MNSQKMRKSLASGGGSCWQEGSPVPCLELALRLWIAWKSWCRWASVCVPEEYEGYCAVGRNVVLQQSLCNFSVIVLDTLKKKKKSILLWLLLYSAQRRIAVFCQTLNFLCATHCEFWHCIIIQFLIKSVKCDCLNCFNFISYVLFQQWDITES